MIIPNVTKELADKYNTDEVERLDITYQVQEGDTLEKIAKKNNLDFNVLEFSMICLQIFNYIARTDATILEVISKIKDTLFVIKDKQEKGEI